MRFIGLAFITIVLAAAAQAEGRTPNIIVFYADDMGYGDVGCFGARYIRTTHIDALAEAGTRLTDYYSAAPICAPSRASLLTGRYFTRIGMSTEKNIPSAMNEPGISTDEITIAELVRPRGYATAAFGKWHLGSTYETQPNAQGFDFFLGHHASCIDPFSHMYYASTPYYHDLYRNRDEVFEGGHHMTDLITRETVRFIRENREQPFLVYVSYNTPHYPMVSQDRFVRMYSHLPMPRRIHAALVAGIDESIGQIMSELQRQALVQDTFVYFSSDNGAADPSDRGEGGGSNAPFREYKRSLFEGGIRMPAIVSWPGQIPAGEARSQLAIAMDLVPTVAEITRAELPPDRILDGQSWMPFLQNASKNGQETLFFEWEGQRAVRQGPWKLVQNGFIDQATCGRQNRARGNNALFLADLNDDPGEQNNLQIQHPEIAERLIALHEAWRLAIEADRPVPSQ